MILSIDHIAFSSPTFEQDVDRFRSLGYQADFVETGLKDLENKQPFMHHFSGHLDMAIMTRKGSMGIELLNHGHVVRDSSYVLPVLEGIHSDLEKTDDSLMVDEHSFVKVRSGFLAAEFFVPDEVRGSELRIDTIILDPNDVSMAARFWSHLGFKPVSVNDQLAHLEFRPFLSGVTFQMLIRGSNHGPRRCLLDGQGFNCLALFSSGGERDHKQFKQLGLDPTEVNAFRVNGKDLRIFWLRGPCGEIVEIIGLS